MKQARRCGSCGFVGLVGPRWVYVGRAWQCPRCVRADARKNPHPKDRDDSPYFGGSRE